MRRDPSNASVPAAAEEERRRERLTHRLEAFSDIIIGFSLAQLGLSLVIPTHAIEFVVRPVGIFAFVVSFIVVVRFWWINFLVFERYFRPTRTMIALNFIALASLILQVFSLQLYLHFGPLQEGAVASRIYFAFFALSYGVQGVMLALGLRHHWKGLSLRYRRAGVRELLARSGIVVGSILGNVMASNDVARVTINVGHQSTLIAHLPTTLFPVTMLGTLVGLLAAWLVPRFLSLHRTT